MISRLTVGRLNLLGHVSYVCGFRTSFDLKKATLDHSVTYPLMGMAGFEPASTIVQLRLKEIRLLLLYDVLI